MYSYQNQTQPKLFELKRRSQKSKRVTWSPDVNLCQVRLFSSADPPSAVGMATHGRRVKPLRPVADDDFPPGFHPAKLWPVKLPQMPLAKWRCPPRVEVNSEWQVASGEESKEIEFQNQRERRLLQAIYPHPSAIPPNPRVNVEESSVSDDYIPLVPLTPIEDVHAALEPTTSPMIIQSKGIATPAVQPDITAAAEAALVAMVSKRSDADWRNMIDQDLLVKILTNPQVLQQLATTTTTSHSGSSNTLPCSSTEYIPELKLPPKNTPEAPHNATPPPTTATTTVPFHPPQLTTGSVVSTSKGVAAVKDINYYRNLVQQHGGGEGRRESVTQFNGAMGTTSGEFARFRDQSKQRMVKPCIYFKTSRGCRNGSNCTYQHDTSSLSRQMVSCNMEVPSAKRVKLCNRDYTTDATSFCS